MEEVRRVTLYRVDRNIRTSMTKKKVRLRRQLVDPLIIRPHSWKLNGLCRYRTSLMMTCWKFRLLRKLLKERPRLNTLVPERYVVTFTRNTRLIALLPWMKRNWSPLIRISRFAWM